MCDAGVILVQQPHNFQYFLHAYMFPTTPSHMLTENWGQSNFWWGGEPGP